MRRVLATAVAVGLVVGLAACGKTNEAARAAGIVPVDALAYVSVTLDPSLVQKKDLFEIAQKFPNARKLVSGNFDISRNNLLQDAVKGACLDFQRDVKPWLGSELAVAILPPVSGGRLPAPVLLIKVDDPTLAKAALDKATARTCHGSGSTASHAPRYRLIRNFAVVVNQAKAADDALLLDAVDRQAQKNGGGLASTAGFADVVNKLASDRLAVGWVDTKAVAKLITRAASSSKTPVSGLNLTGVGNCDLASLGLGNSSNATHIAFDLRATPSSIMVEGLADGSVTKAPGGVPKLTEGLPGDTMAAGTVFDIGSMVRAVLSCTGMADKTAQSFNKATGLNLDADVLALLGGETVLVTGSTSAGGRLPGVGLITAISDHAKAATAVDHLVAAMRQRNVTLTETTVAGVKAYEIGLFSSTQSSASSSAGVAGGSDSVAALGGSVVPSIQPPVIPGGGLLSELAPTFALFGDRLVLATSPKYLAELATTAPASLGSASDYQTVLGSARTDATSAQLVVRFGQIRNTLEKLLTGKAKAAFDSRVAPNLVPLQDLAARSFVRDGSAHFEVRISFS